MAILSPVDITCRRCGLRLRATAGDGVLVLRAAAAEWARTCWLRPDAHGPMACRELVGSVAAKASGADAPPPLPPTRP